MSLALADTSVWARYRQPRVARLLAAAVRLGALAIAAPVTLELLRGARDVEELHSDAGMYDDLLQVEMSPAMVRRARDVQERLGRRGYHRGPSAVDLLTAAAAESVDAELWHCDRHFELIAEVTGQRVRKVGR